MPAEYGLAWTSETGARCLLKTLRAFWRDYPAVEFELVQQPNCKCKEPVGVIRSDLRCGLPPDEMAARPQYPWQARHGCLASNDLAAKQNWTA